MTSAMTSTSERVKRRSLSVAVDCVLEGIIGTVANVMERMLRNKRHARLITERHFGA